jgi:hypothetical protein
MKLFVIGSNNIIFAKVTCDVSDSVYIIKAYKLKFKKYEFLSDYYRISINKEQPCQ